ncbi:MULTISPECIES: hypothetical protein [unclassified Pseudomonas]|uniref:hypothetical protein n=1 Tax=unclassified Pseudomonas TaxID=196821 RepID=UPI000C2FCE34|nr:MULTISPECIES: hypothetical protein [unclassified Pseudomonas]MCU1736347.1 hypothetical protein [Pseudomonas sp. 20S_6.2_Bac1]
MPHIFGSRPLLARLNSRIQKYSGCTTVALGTDIALHRQSVEELVRLHANQEELLSAAREALAVINRIKPAGNGNGTQVRLAEAIAKATQ